MVPRTASLTVNFLNFAYHKKGLEMRFNFLNHSILQHNPINKKLFCSFPFIHFAIQQCNSLYPYTFLKIISNNLMAVCINQHLFDVIDKIIPDKENQSLTVNLCKSICSLGLPLIAQYNYPDLLNKYTCLSLSQIICEYLPASDSSRYISFSVCALLDNYSPIKKINYIFEAKQTMLLILMILACFNIKLKYNSILTNPAYWLPIGIAHLLFNQYELFIIENRKSCAAVKFYFVTCHLFRINPEELQYNYKKNAIAAFISRNVIPIAAVLISAALPD
jgi:hypothetical protein